MLSSQTTLWPLHPKPLPGEVLSSWVSRIAAANGFSLLGLRNRRLPKGEGESTDLDLIHDQEFFHELSRATGLPIEESFQTGYAYDEGRVFARFRGNFPNWIIRSNSFAKPHRGAMPFCPGCLATDAQPYYRKRWRYGFLPVCLKHGLLTEFCPRCGTPYRYIGPDRTPSLYLPSGTLGICRHCEQRFEDRPPRGLSDALLSSVSSIQNEIEDALEQGWMEAQTALPVHICLYLQGMHCITRLLLNPTYGPQIYAWSSHELGIPDPPGVQAIRTNVVEALFPVERAWILLLANWLLKDWPDKFLAIAALLKRKPSAFRSDLEDLPGWLRHESLGELFAVPHSRSAEEIESAKELLRRKRHWACNIRELDHFMRTGELTPVRPLVLPASEGSLAFFAAEAEVADIQEETHQALLDARRYAPRKIYKIFRALRDEMIETDDTTEKLFALHRWRRRKDSEPTSG